MAGRQFSFFLSPADEGDFARALLESGDIAFLKELPLSAQPEELDTSRVFQMGEKTPDILIALRSDISDLEFRPIAGRENFWLDETTSPGVSFSRCYVTDRFIRPGRLYCTSRYWGTDRHLVTKPQEFLEWTHRLFKRGKQSLTRVEHGYFAGKNALKLRQSGVAFEQLDAPIGSIAG